MARCAEENLLAALAGERPRNLVNAGVRRKKATELSLLDRKNVR